MSPDYRQKDFPPQGPAPSVPGRGMVPFKSTSPNPPHNVQRALDTLASSGHRVIAAFGLHGGDRFLIPNGVDPTSLTRIYPDNDTPRVIRRGISIPLTPGCFLGLDLIALPSGPTQVEDPGVSFIESGRGGRVVLEVTYRTATNTTTSSCTISIDGSGEVFAAEPPNAFENMLTPPGVVAWPWPLVVDAAEFAKWGGGGVLADFTLSIYGALRPIDGTVVERPWGITVDQAATTWPSNMYTEAGAAYSQPPIDYPVEQLTDTDPAAGTLAIHRALLSHGRQLGPMLAWWGAGTEHTHTLADWISYDGGTGDDECPPIGQISQAWAHVPTLAAPDNNQGGFAIGHYARQADRGDAFFDGRTSELPVWVAVYGKGDSAEFKIQTGDPTGPEWSAIITTTKLGAFEWMVEPGWLEVGLGPEDAPTLRLFGRSTDPGDRWDARYMYVFFRPT